MVGSHVSVIVYVPVCSCLGRVQGHPIYLNKDSPRSRAFKSPWLYEMFGQLLSTFQDEPGIGKNHGVTL